MRSRGVAFFFQAEDGIRDWSVTGVQTCALPIWAIYMPPLIPHQAVGFGSGPPQQMERLLPFIMPLIRLTALTRFLMFRVTPFTLQMLPFNPLPDLWVL